MSKQQRDHGSPHGQSSAWDSLGGSGGWGSP